MPWKGDAGMVRLWGILRKKHKIMQDVVVEVDRADLEGAREAVDLCSVSYTHLRAHET